MATHLLTKKVVIWQRDVWLSSNHSWPLFSNVTHESDLRLFEHCWYFFGLRIYEILEAVQFLFVIRYSLQSHQLQCIRNFCNKSKRKLWICLCSANVFMLAQQSHQQLHDMVYQCFYCMYWFPSAEKLCPCSCQEIVNDWIASFWAFKKSDMKTAPGRKTSP